jgi:hypothetical protein
MDGTGAAGRSTRACAAHCARWLWGALVGVLVHPAANDARTATVMVNRLIDLTAPLIPASVISMTPAGTWTLKIHH